MAVKVTFDTANRLIIVNSGVTSLDVKVDLYSDAKEDWENGSLDIDSVRLNKFIFPFRVIGGDDTAPGEKAPLYAYLTGGWRVRPQEASDVLDIINGALLVDGDTTLDPFVDTVGNFNVRIRMFVPVKGTILESGTSGLTPTESDALLQNTTDLSAIALDIIDINTDITSILANIVSIDGSTTFMEAIESGEQRVINNQMIFYNPEGVETVRFNLFDESGNPTMINVFRRVPV